jgi:hypothetical protein
MSAAEHFMYSLFQQLSTPRKAALGTKVEPKRRRRGTRLDESVRQAPDPGAGIPTTTDGNGYSPGHNNGDCNAPYDTGKSSRTALTVEMAQKCGIECRRGGGVVWRIRGLCVGEDAGWGRTSCGALARMGCGGLWGGGFGATFWFPAFLRERGGGGRTRTRTK